MDSTEATKRADPCSKPSTNKMKNLAIETKICVRVREQIKNFSLIEHTEPPNPTGCPAQKIGHVCCRRLHGAVHHHGVQTCTIPAAPSPLVIRPTIEALTYTYYLIAYDIVSSQT